LDKDYEALKIGVMLHDIGKLLERGGYTGDKELYKNSYGHEKSGVKFFEEYFDKFGFNFLPKESKDIIKNIIGKHHCENISSNEKSVNIVKLADWLSSGERIYSEKKIEGGRQTQGLCSIFEEISLNDINDINDEKEIEYSNFGKYNLVELKITKDIFPKKIYPKEKYKNLVNKFLKEVDNNIDNFEKLCQLMYKYTWCVPSATYSIKGKYLPDISLYDHSKTTCAIACCLYQGLNKGIDYEEDIISILKDGTKKTHKAWRKDIFSLIHGDISGIQNFIFKITSKGANKSLKGRSFYIDFLAEICARYIIKELNLPITNILFVGGGHFYILSYKIDSTLNFEKKINDILFEKFGIDLYVALGKVDLSPIDFLINRVDDNSGIPYKWRKVAEVTSKREMKKFDYKGDELFKPRGQGGDIKICSVCKQEGKVSNSERKCRYCLSFEKLTRKLIDFEKNKVFKIDEIKDLDIFKDFFENDMVKFENTIYNLPDENGNLKIPYKICSMAFPFSNGTVRDFSELANDSEGVKKLAILKMDVDNLGKIITKGLGENATISRLSTLSSMLSLFFTGYIPYLIKSNNIYKKSIYLTYSGGDDTLIVGAWDKIWDLAKKIRKEFHEFTCENKYITLSAGIALVDPKFEFKKGVSLAEKELERAKDNFENDNKKEKNSICIFGYPIFWDSIDELNRLEENFIKALNSKKMKKRILHISQKVFNHLRKILKIKEDDAGNEKIIVNISYLWRMRYYLYKNYPKENGELESYVKFIEDYLKNIEKYIIEGNIDKLKQINFNTIIVAARIAELKSRNNEEEIGL